MAPQDIPPIHDEHGHLPLFERHPQILRHLQLPRSEGGHGLSPAHVSRLIDSVSQNRVNEYRWRVRKDDWCSHQTDRLMIGHERLHDQIEDPYLAWVRDVHVVLHARGYHPRLVEIEFDGFEQDFDEYSDDPIGLCSVLISALISNGVEHTLRLSGKEGHHGIG